MTLFEELTWRQLIHQCTHEELARELEREPLSVYCGFDPTADSLHIGHLLAIMGLAHFQRAGHRPIALVGGATGMIGDPSGKSEERNLLTAEAVERNTAAIGGQLGRFLDFSGENAAILVNNADWFRPITLLDFLRDIGKHFSVNAMLAKESVRQRISNREHGISFTEFSYQLLQAYDFLQLYDQHGCRLQIGGSDQWGNIVAGMDLTRRLREGANTFGLTFPLLTKSDGTKFGKTAGGAVWLSAERTSPYKFYQYWMNQADADVPKLLRCFTFLSHEEIRGLERETEEAPHKRAGQRRLAEEVTRMAHGEAGLERAQRGSQVMFGGDLQGIDEATLLEVFEDVPSYKLPAALLEEQPPLLDVLLHPAVDPPLFSSRGEVRRLVKNGGLYVNNQRIESETRPFSPELRTTGTTAVVRTGKKKYHLFRFGTA